MFRRQVLGLVECCDRQLGSTSHHEALGHPLDKLLVVGQIAEQNADNHADGRGCEAGLNGDREEHANLELGVFIFLDQLLLENELITQCFESLKLLLLVVVDSGELTDLGAGGFQAFVEFQNLSGEKHRLLI